MAADEQCRRYLESARKLHSQPRSEERLFVLNALPLLTPKLMKKVALETATLALHQPSLACTLASLANDVAERQDDGRLQGLAAFNLARAANAWVQPQLVREAAERGRQRFLDLDEPGWAAACAWQRYAVPWACNTFDLAAETLEQALAGLEAPEVSHWQLECRRSLAFARILLTEYEAALAHLAICEQHYRQAGSVAGLARTLTSKAAGLRRLSRFDSAIEAAGLAIDLLTPLDRPLDLALAHFQLGNVLLLKGSSYQDAERLLQRAHEGFGKGNVLLWVAQCHYAFSRLFRDTGRLSEAATALQKAREIFAEFPLLGLRADSLLDSAVFALRTGHADRAIDHVAEAEPYYRQLGVLHMVAFCHVYRGEAYAELGRYQLALQHLEQGYRQLRAQKVAGGAAEAALRLGEVWLWLDRPQEALSYLYEARPHFEEVGHTSFLAEIYSLLTAARLRNGDDVKEIITAARQTLSRLEPHGVQPYLALLQRFIGEVYLATGQSRQALSALQEAIEKFETMSLEIDLAECYLTLGRCYRALSQPQAAAISWQKALALSDHGLPQVEWQAFEGLAQLAADAGDEAQALARYRQMIEAFSRLRRWFWQPSVAGAYLSRSVQALDRAVLMAGSQQSVQTARFVEEGKVQTVNNRLQSTARYWRAAATVDESLRDLAEEIRWLQQEITAARHSNAPAPLLTHKQSELVEKVRQHETLTGRVERQKRKPAPLSEGRTRHNFEETVFRQALTSMLGEQWLALDYYLTADSLLCVILSATDEIVRLAPLAPRTQRALDLLTRSRPTAGADLEDWLAAASETLLPWDILHRLEPDKALVISPHRRLHRLPWAALPDKMGRPLVAHCVPLVTPSLQSLSLLQQRATVENDPRHGCVLAVSDFGRRHTPLPETRQEANSLASQMNERGTVLCDEDATWEALRELAVQGGLAKYAFLHVASHAFYDAVSGRASGLALHDRDVWLDEVWELAPLPPLFTLSACSGMQSYLYEGDEPIGLATTCLQAGAQHVVGSLWPVRDADAASVMSAFYRYFYKGSAPHRALALAQRQAASGELAWRCWAPFICVGALERD